MDGPSPVQMAVALHRQPQACTIGCRPIQKATAMYGWSQLHTYSCNPVQTVLALFRLPYGHTKGCRTMQKAATLYGWSQLCADDCSLLGLQQACSNGCRPVYHGLYICTNGNSFVQMAAAVYRLPQTRLCCHTVNNPRLHKMFAGHVTALNVLGSTRD